MAVLFAAAATSSPLAATAPSSHGSAQPVVVRRTAPEILDRVQRTGARATLVNVWATWCAPCREEFPALLEVARERKPEGLRLVLVSADFPEQMPAVRKFLAARGVKDTSYLKTGDDQTFISTFHPRWSGALPATFVYDSTGRQVDFWEGRADADRFQRAVNAALAPPASEETQKP